ncbi:sulfotransferase family protein [Gordonia sp. PKS22-38]|uniref:Sulfotransferase family protein n=1 Tax=Gordonia prachuapensis TaxID=3115651 RepID=A0ABU7MWI7_9ACTN|nr:sulfotransferase family protein [Gordonia sp. PKS22-38]
MSVVFIHIGLPKTGTTHLQDRLWRNRDLALESSGLLYPGNRMTDHFHAATHLQPERYLDWVNPDFADAWPNLVAQMKAWPGKSLVSHELLATAKPEHIATLLSDLSFADEIHVIATVRDLARQLPSVWQENIKNQRRADFAEFLASVREHGPAVPGFVPPVGGDEEEPFWEFQDYVRILSDWADAVGPQRVHLVTVSPSRDTPGESIWERFLRVLDVDPAPLTLDVPTTNSSLPAAQAEYLRRLNHHLQPSDVHWSRYDGVVKGQVIQILKRAKGAPLGLTAEQRVWAAEAADDMVEAMRTRGYQVTGDLADLAVSTTAGADAEPPTDEQVLDVAVETMAEMVKQAPIRDNRPRLRTRGMNVVRRVRRRVLGWRRSK